jgi:polysaccharide deacetylase family protein (PEP-CTERM system associated)
MKLLSELLDRISNARSTDLSAPSQGVALAGASQHSTRRSHVLTVSLEDYYHAAPLRRWIPCDIWYRFEERLVRSTERTLDLLARHGTRATFFVPGYLAATMPDLIRKVARAGHEIGSSGYSHRGLWDLGITAFSEDVRRARQELEDVSGSRVLGFRMPQGWLGARDLWVFEVLAEAGYLYDSSIRPLFHTFGSRSWQQELLALGQSGYTFYEVPVSSARLCGLELPIAGGGGLRHLPKVLMRRAVSRWDRSSPHPYVMYFRTWELDPEQPRISIAPLVSRFRQYRNLDRMPALLDEYLSTYRFTSVAEYFRIAVELPVAQAETPRTKSISEAASVNIRVPEATANPAPRMPVTVVVPCYNESQALPYLRNTLHSVTAAYQNSFEFTFLFVDDCSMDDTWQMLHALFGSDPACRFIRHERNRGMTATIRTGIEQARTEVVCSIDCDCSYDPHELGKMIPMLTEGVDLVTASPYHPRGGVRDVQRWRISLSMWASAAYRLALRQKLYTYTSCFRVYRRSSVLGLELREAGYMGMGEMIGLLHLQGGRTIEWPATLEARVLGLSKMKVLRNTLGHLRVLTRLAALRVLRALPWAGKPEKGEVRRVTGTAPPPSVLSQNLPGDARVLESEHLRSDRISRRRGDRRVSA